MRARRVLGSWAAAIAVVLAGSACTGPSPDTAAPTDDRPLAAFYGDSYTRGTGASSPDRRWSTILCATRGWDELNRSENGLGFVNRRQAFGPGSNDIPELIVEAAPDIVFVTMGLNDSFSYDRVADRIRETIRDDLGRLRDGLPDARIVVVEPFWYTAERPASVDVIAGWVKEGADAIGADWIGGASRWLDGHHADSDDSWMAGDGLHPDDTGYARIAERMDRALRDLDPPL